MRRLLRIVLVAALLGAVAAPSARAEFGFHDLDVTFTGRDGEPPMQAGSHPLTMTTSFKVNSIENEDGIFADGAVKDQFFEQPPGFAGNPTAVPRCTNLDFLKGPSGCPDSAAIGEIVVTLGGGGLPPLDSEPFPVYLLERPPGVAAKIGFWATNTVSLTIDVGVNPKPPYNVVASSRNTPQILEVFGASLTLWGNPAAAVHDARRGRCLLTPAADSCSAGIPVKPFITLPRSCTGPLVTVFRATSWPVPGLDPGRLFEGTAETHDDSIPPSPLGTTGCSRLHFAPHTSAQPTTDHASSPTGLDFTLEVNDEGLLDPNGTAHSDIKKTVVTLPEGMTVNPSVAEGLITCSLAQLDAETVSSAPGEGCPEASKVGTVEVETPVLEGTILKGQVFVAQQDDPAAPGKENPFDSLIAIYLVIKDPDLGIVVKQAGKVEPNPRTGQLVSTFDDIPQFPLGQVRFRFREGGRSPLISPPRCGNYSTKAEFTPWADPAKTVIATSDFQITRGVAGGPCPSPGTPPFVPGFEAGTIDSSAGSYSPFYMRITRRDGDQDITRFSSTLPPGLVGKLAGVGRCPDAAIAAAAARTGRAELAAPSCPADSRIGRVLGGAGVGSQLTYVPGSLYLAGPYKGAPLSVVAIVPAVAGPFDAGTVVVRVALDLDPRTAQVEVDGAASDPIPHILKGLPLKVRDLRVYVDRREFILNPTSCDPSTVRARVWGGGLDLFSVVDDAPFAVAAPFQAANCSDLAYEPRLSMRLKGGTGRGGHPALRAVFKPRPGDANTARTVVRLPRSAFLDQGHIRTICTRVQFAADACPKGAAYGQVTAFSPLLDEPLRGPAYLRSSDNELPDLVFDLHGLVDIEASARIDSVKGGIRATFGAIPDAPITKVVIDMQGGKKGLIVNSRDLCAGRARAGVRLTAHNGKQRRLRPLVRATGCSGKPRR